MFMWIAGRQRPDFRTINRFRSEGMKDVLEKKKAANGQYRSHSGVGITS
ncbi:hypothetical protein ACFW1P_17220 [Paenibacillus sp. NPDC058910]